MVFPEPDNDLIKLPTLEKLSFIVFNTMQNQQLYFMLHADFAFQYPQFPFPGAILCDR